MTRPSDPIFDGTNPHAMADDEPPSYEGKFMRAVEELLRRTKDLRILINEGSYTYEKAFVMVEKQAERVRLLNWILGPPENRNIREVIQQIIPLIPVDTPNPDDDFTGLKGELESCASNWFSAPEIEMPLWIGVATILEEWLEEPKAVPVHADGGKCHGTALDDAGKCPGCGLTPDMQSIELQTTWPEWKWAILTIFSGKEG